MIINKFVSNNYFIIPKVSKTLISLGADVNARTDTYQTPLHLVCVAGHLNLMKLLIMYKTKINAKDDTQQTALHKWVLFSDIQASRIITKQ